MKAESQQLTEEPESNAMTTTDHANDDFIFEVELYVRAALLNAPATTGLIINALTYV